MIDFTKPIQYKYKGANGTAKVLYFDTDGALLLEKNEKKFVTIEHMNCYFENVPETKKEIKGFIGFYGNIKGMTSIYSSKIELKAHWPEVHTITEINAKEGDGL